jgi:hypothetical protein
MTRTRESRWACIGLMAGGEGPGIGMTHSREGRKACSRPMVGGVCPGRDDPL